jgi:hypothetical protein
VEGGELLEKMFNSRKKRTLVWENIIRTPKGIQEHLLIRKYEEQYDTMPKLE